MQPDAPPKPYKLGILAGGGELPRLLIQACRRLGRDVFVIAFKDQCDPQTVEDVDHAWVRLGAAGKSILHLKDNAVVDLVMAGRIRRPSVTALMAIRTVIAFWNLADSRNRWTLPSGPDCSGGMRRKLPSWLVVSFMPVCTRALPCPIVLGAIL